MTLLCSYLDDEHGHHGKLGASHGEGRRRRRRRWHEGHLERLMVRSLKTHWNTLLDYCGHLTLQSTTWVLGSCQQPGPGQILTDHGNNCCGENETSFSYLPAALYSLSRLLDYVDKEIYELKWVLVRFNLCVYFSFKKMVTLLYSLHFDLSHFENDEVRPYYCMWLYKQNHRSIHYETYVMYV